jgi:hypothetical protein
MNVAVRVREDRVAVSEDNYSSTRASESNAGVPAPPATPLAQKCLLNEFRRHDVGKLQAMKRCWPLRKARYVRRLA